MVLINGFHCMYKNSAHCSIGEIISNFPADASSSSGVKDACTHTRDCKTCNQEATSLVLRTQQYALSAHMKKSEILLR